MYTKIGGKIIDPKDNQGIYGATVYITDSKGAVRRDKTDRPIGIVKTDTDGTYILPFSIPIPNMATGGTMPIPFGTHLSIDASNTGYPKRLYEIPKEMFNPKETGNAKYDVTLDLGKVQEVQEVVVTASKNAYECKKLGGIYDAKNNSCTLPNKAAIVMPKVEEKSWFKKNWWWVVGGGVLLVTVVTIMIIKKNKK
jgi:hypothetical protein